MKATYGVVNGEPRNIFKDPKTDSGFKKSAKGLIRVNYDGTITDECTPEQFEEGRLRVVFEDGKLIVDESLAEIRARLAAEVL
jgi:nicotinamide phosphoribosyltransferase